MWKVEKETVGVFTKVDFSTLTESKSLSTRVGEGFDPSTFLGYP